MTTAIAVYNSDGCVGRCDAKCHDAREPECDCVCGGRLHGVGRDNAVTENTQYFVDRAEEWAKAHGIEDPEIRFPGYEKMRLALEERA